MPTCLTILSLIFLLAQNLYTCICILSSLVSTRLLECPCMLNFRLHGSYEAIEGGQSMDALVDLTGGIPRLYEIQDKDPFLYRMIEKAQQKGAFITCSRKVSWCCTLFIQTCYDKLSKFINKIFSISTCIICSN